MHVSRLWGALLCIIIVRNRSSPKIRSDGVLLVKISQSISPLFCPTVVISHCPSSLTQRPGPDEASNGAALIEWCTGIQSGHRYEKRSNAG